MKALIFSIFLFSISTTTCAQENSFEWTDSTFTVGAKKELKLNFFLGDYCEQDDENQSVTDSLIMMLNKYCDLKINIISHSDSRGAEKANEALTVRRAKLFKCCLIESGIDGNRIFTIGKGESNPIFSDENINKLETTKEKSEALTKNRRVEIQIKAI